MGPPFALSAGIPWQAVKRAGVSSAKANLFDSAAFLLCPTPFTADRDIALAKEAVKALHACPVLLSPDEHDKDVALTSHLPHVLAASLCKLASLHETREGILRRMCAGSFKDGTRVSASDPAFWADILVENASGAAPSYDEYIGLLERVKSAAVCGDKDSLSRFSRTPKPFAKRSDFFFFHE